MKEYKINSDTKGAFDTKAIESAYNRESEKSVRTLARGDINSNIESLASGLTAMGKAFVKLEATPKANGANGWLEMRELIITACNSKLPRFEVLNVPTFGERVESYDNRDKSYICTLSRSYAVIAKYEQAQTFASVLLASVGFVIPTITDFPTAEKIAKILNRLFQSKESPSMVFGKSKEDAKLEAERLREQNQRLLKELAELKQELVKK